MSSRPGASRGSRSAAALVLTLLPLLGLAPAASYADPSPSPGAGPNDDAPLRVDVLTLLPRAPRPGQAFEVTGRLTNLGDSPVRDARVRLRIGERIASRTGLAEADQDRPPTGSRLQTQVRPTRPDLAPGQSTTFDLRTTTDELRLGRLGVYPLDIEAVGLFAGLTGPLGVAATYLPWFEGARTARTRVAALWPLVDRPRLGPDGVLLDDALAGSLSPGGRLGTLLAAARRAETGSCDPAPRPPSPAPAGRPRRGPRPRCDPAPVTYAVDPDLLLTAERMTHPYRVRDGSRTRPGQGSAAAEAFLASLGQALHGSRVLALPYADPDVDALTRTSAGKNDLGVAQELGGTVVGDVLGTAPLATVAWPPDGPVSPAAVDALATGSTSALVLAGSAFPPAVADAGLTAGTRTALPQSTSGGALTGLVVDEQLSRLLAGAGTSPSGVRLAEQRWLVETAMIAAERPGLSRTVLVAPPRRGSVVAAVAAAALQDLGRLPWLCPVPLSAVAAGDEHCPGTAATGPQDHRADRGNRGVLRTDRRGELSASYLRRVARQRDHAVQLVESVLNPSDAASLLKRRLLRAVARAESSAWRTDPPGGRRSTALLSHDLAGLLAKVQVHGGRLLLTGANGVLNVGVDNTLPVPITVRVRFVSRTATLSTLQTGLLEVLPSRRRSASVRAQARTSGQFVVTAQLLDRDNRPIPGAAADVIVRSTRYGRVAVALTGLGAGVLLVAAGVRLTRRALRHTRAAG